MKFSGINVRRGIAGACAGSLLGGMALRDYRRAVGRGRARRCSAERAVGHRQLGDGRRPRLSRQPPGRRSGGHRGVQPAASAGGRNSARILHRQSAASTRTCGASWRRSVTSSASATWQCCRRISPRPTASSWPAEFNRRRPAAAALAVAAGFSYCRTERLDCVHEDDENSRDGGGVACPAGVPLVRRPPSRSPAPAPPPAPKTTIDADGTYAVGADIHRGGTPRQGPSATARATGNGSAGRHRRQRAVQEGADG